MKMMNLVSKMTESSCPRGRPTDAAGASYAVSMLVYAAFILFCSVFCAKNDGLGRRVQTNPTSTSGTGGNSSRSLSRDLIAETNVDAFRFDSDKCIGAISREES